jgi:hypothetical protein
MRRSLLFVFAITILAQAQVISVGVKAGVPASSANPFAELKVNTGRWTAGVTTQVHLVSGLYVEADALMRSYSYTRHDPSPSNRYYQDVKAWDFPFMLKYCVGEVPARPFVAAGYSLTHESYDVSTLAGHQRASSNGTGPVVGIGIELRHGRIAFSPELRYTYLTHSGPAGSNGNLLIALVGVTF